jgi:hypothetical protein
MSKPTVKKYHVREATARAMEHLVRMIDTDQSDELFMYGPVGTIAVAFLDAAAE